MLSCRFCEKQYKSPSAHHKHMLLCNKRFPRDNDNNDDNNDDNNNDNDILNNTLNKDVNKNVNVSEKELKNMVFALINEVSSLKKQVSNQQKEITKLKNASNLKLKKIEILEWLNDKQPQNEKPMITFDKYKNESKIKLNESHLQLIFDKGHMSGFEDILKNIIDNSNENIKYKLPICGFNQRENTLYIYNNKWVTLTNYKFVEFIQVINKQILLLYSEWEEKQSSGENRGGKQNDKQDSKLLENLEKVHGFSVDNNTKYAKLHKCLYDKIKINFKKIIEIDID